MTDPISDRIWVRLRVVCTDTRHPAGSETVRIALLDDTYGDGSRVGYESERLRIGRRKGSEVPVRTRGVTIKKAQTGTWYRFQCSKCSNEKTMSKVELLLGWDALIFEQADERGRVAGGEVTLDLCKLMR